MLIRNKSWAEDRIKKLLIKVGTKQWDFSDSLLLYSNLGQESYKDANKKDSDYYKFVTQEELIHINKILKNISSELPEEFNFIDLGPGSEKKE